jgi:hypothetical protein
MTSILKAAVSSLALLAPAALAAQAIELVPADPQPQSSTLASGLAVSYATLPNDTRSLSRAKWALEREAEPGAPLAGLTYDDTAEGDPVLTSGKSQMVGAEISGYIKFDAPGTYTLDFLTNDGLEIFIGGQQVGLYDGVHACGYAGEVEVVVPSAGYYPVEATYFQRKGTACLMMEWGTDADGLEFVTENAFFHAR